MEMDKEYILEYFKCRDVKSPEKFGNAAGWDFYIPNDLTIFDFLKTNIATIYTNEFLNINKNKSFLFPLIFSYKNEKDEELKYVIEANLQAKEPEKFTIKRIKTGKYLGIIPYTKYVNISFEEKDLLSIVLIDHILIKAGGKVLIPSGIYVKLPSGIFLNAENKSGIASKRSLLRGACVIDNDYQRGNSYKSFKCKW